MTLPDGTPFPLPVVLDDITGVLDSDKGKGIIKAALDTTGKRTVCYKSTSKQFTSKGLDDQFEMVSKFVYITNTNMDSTNQHLKAVASRCHSSAWLTEMEVFVWCKHIAHTTGAISDNLHDKTLGNKVWQFIEINWGNLIDADLRALARVADKANKYPTDWQQRCASVYMHDAYITRYIK